MNRRNIIALLIVAALSVAGFAVATAGGSAQSQGDQPASSSEADAAADAALKAVPGELLEVEAEDDGTGGFEVEILTADGTEVEVHIGEDGTVVGMDNDDDGPNEDDGDGADDSDHDEDGDHDDEGEDDSGSTNG